MQLKKRKLVVIGTLTAMVVAVVVATHALDDKNKKATDKQAAPKTEMAKVKPALTVTLTTPESTQWPRSLMANGSIAAWQEAVIGAEIGGLRLTDVRVNVGDTVKRGQLLAQIAGETVVSELAQAKAAVDEALALNAEAVSNAARSRQLLAQNFISAQQLAQTEAAEQAASARLAAARARLQSSQLRLAQTQVIAPDDGVISARMATVGSLAQVGQELFRLIRQHRLEWRAEVTAAELARIKAGEAVSLTTADGAQVKGKVRAIAPTVDPQTRTGLVYVDLPTGSPARAGTFARGQFELGAMPALTLPQSAVLLRDGFSYVFQVEGGDKVSLKKVAVGRRVGDRIEITEGLTSAAQVVVTGAGFLADGDSVHVVAAATPKATQQ